MREKKITATKWRVTLGNNDADPGALCWQQAWPRGSGTATYLVSIPVKTEEEATRFIKDLIKTHNETKENGPSKWFFVKIQKAD